MSIFSVLAIFITVAAVATYLNYKLIRLPTTIGVMVIGLSMSLVLIGIDRLGVDITGHAEKILSQIDFSEALMKGMLSFLLFAGALKININDLLQRKYIISLLATVGVLMTTFIVGTIIYLIIDWLGLKLPYIYCLVFGALIAPTDPVAVLSLLKSIRAPKSLEIKIAGESLFNDGVGVVVFTVLAGIALGGHEISVGHIALLFAEEAIGGVIFGLVIGYLAYRMLKGVDDYFVEILITLALVCGGYALASYLHTSGPIAIVVAGLLIGNQGRRLAMSDHTREQLGNFWELIDEILNAVLFIWIGMEILVLPFEGRFLWIGLLAIPVVIGARFFSVWSAVSVLRFKRTFSPNVIKILTWGGLRGGISIALALSLPSGGPRDLIVSITYVIVVFSILVQGLTIKKIITVETED